MLGNSIVIVLLGNIHIQTSGVVDFDNPKIEYCLNLDSDASQLI